MLLDEPSTGLDPVARGDVWRYLEEVRRDDGVTILLTTHLMDEADRCDRVAIMDLGKLVAFDTPAALKERVGGDVIALRARDAGAASTMRGVLKEKFGIDAGGDAAGDVGDAGEATTVRFERPRGHEFIPPLLEALPGGIVESVSVGKPTLEDVFVHVTGRRFRAREEQPAR
jgi:ABC-2 type transport system ATP-binding protein